LADSKICCRGELAPTYAKPPRIDPARQPVLESWTTEKKGRCKYPHLKPIGRGKDCSKKGPGRIRGATRPVSLPCAMVRTRPTLRRIRAVAHPARSSHRGCKRCSSLTLNRQSQAHPASRSASCMSQRLNTGIVVGISREDMVEANSSFSHVRFNQVAQTFGLGKCSKSFSDIGSPQHIQTLTPIFSPPAWSMALLENRATRNDENLLTS